MTCPVADCKAAFWRHVVEHGFMSMSRGFCNADGEAVARDDRDARLALSSAELVCKSFHGAKP